MSNTSPFSFRVFGKGKELSVETKLHILVMAHVNSSSESSRKRRKIDKTNKNESISLSAMEEMKNAMYSSCASHEQTQTFSQEQLLALNIIPNRDVTLLQQCAETLSKEGLFKVMTKNGRLCWRVVKKADAAR